MKDLCRYLLFSVSIFLIGCVHQNRSTKSNLDYDLVFIGELDSYKTIDVVQGDVLEVWDGYRITSIGVNVESVEFVSSGPGCFIKTPNEPNGLYIVFFKERELIDSEGSSDTFEAVLCIEVEEETSDYLRAYLAVEK